MAQQQQDGEIWVPRKTIHQLLAFHIIDYPDNPKSGPLIFLKAYLSRDYRESIEQVKRDYYHYDLESTIKALAAALDSLKDRDYFPNVRHRLASYRCAIADVQQGRIIFEQQAAQGEFTVVWNSEEHGVCPYKIPHGNFSLKRPLPETVLSTPFHQWPVGPIDNTGLSQTISRLRGQLPETTVLTSISKLVEVRSQLPETPVSLSFPHWVDQTINEAWQQTVSPIGGGGEKTILVPLSGNNVCLRSRAPHTICAPS